MKPVISMLGSGWLGLPLAHYFQQQGHTVRLSSRSAEKCASLAQSGFDMHRIDIDALIPAVDAFLKADILIINITNKSLPAFNELCRHIKTSTISNIIFISSSSVYQNLNRVVTEDEQAENPDSPLFQIEQQLRHHSGCALTVVRLSGLVGPKRHPGRFFRGGKTVKQPLAPINLIHRDDCIGIIAHIVQQQAWNNVFNGCADSHPNKREFYSYASAQLGQSVPEFEENSTLHFKIVSNEKVKKHLAYQFRHPDLMQLDLEDYA